MTRAFVAGATGYTGREVVRLLRERDVDAIAHVRPDSSRLADWRERFEALGARIDATPWDQAAMNATLANEKPALVFALLGTTRERQSKADDPSANSYEAVDYGLNAMVLKAAVAAGHGPRFVYLSAIGADTGRGAYLEVRKRLEAEVIASGLPYTIARPSFITGADREGRPGERVGAAVADGALAVAGLLGMRGLRDRYTSLTGAELAGGLVRAGMDPEAAGRILEVADLRP